MLYKDSCNRKSNQQNLGTIKCSNLCTEIVEYSAPDEIAVCNLASIAVNQFVNVDGPKISYDFAKLKEVTKVRISSLVSLVTRDMESFNTPLRVLYQSFSVIIMFPYRLLLKISTKSSMSIFIQLKRRGGQI